MNRQLVLIHASEDDPHADAVAQCLRRMGAPVETLIGEGFGKDWFVSEGAPGVVVSKGEHRWGRDEIRTVYWREAPPMTEGPLPPTATAGAEAELVSSKLARSFHRLCRERPFVNDLDAHRQASCRELQRRIAAELGLKVRRVFEGGSLEEAEAFAHQLWSEGRSCIWEPMGGSLRADPRRPTAKPLLPNDLERLQQRGLAPVRLREVLDRLYDYRVTLVGDELFACRLQPPASAAEPSCEAAILPAETGSRLLALRRQLGLLYATVDLVETRDHELYFERANSVGQWLWVETLTGLPITDAVARHLLHPSADPDLASAA